MSSTSAQLPRPRDEARRLHIDRWRSGAAVGVGLAILLVVSACSFGGGDAAEAGQTLPADVEDEARTNNEGELYQFVVDSQGFVSAPTQLPAGEITLTLSYTGDTPAPHSLVFEGINGDQPLVAVDLPGSNNGSVVVPAGDYVFFDGAPGNREKGYHGRVRVTGPETTAPPVEPQATLSWTAEGLEFISEPGSSAPADVPIALELTVNDALPHSIALDQVRGEQPLVAVDGPGTNRRTITLPSGTYAYFCAVPGHREVGMEGFVTIE